MDIGIVGLGRMGGNMARRLSRAGVRVVGFDVESATRSALRAERALEPADSVQGVVAKLATPRIVWLMVPAGATTELTIEDVWPELARGDVIVDGGNAYYKDSQRRAAALASAGIHFVDCGVSGGVWGLENGYTLTYGATPHAAHDVLPYMKILAPAHDRGHLHCGAPGAGHFVKMIHNGIEYGMMQAYAEGFDILKNANIEALPADHRYDFDLADIAEVWRRGSVIPSWLLDLTSTALADSPALAEYSGFVADSGEGRWTIEAAIEEAVPAEVLSSALFARFRSRKEHTFGEKLLSAMRFGFGGHVE